jgi:O-antigen/teichoic acid export membrane protein
VSSGLKTTVPAGLVDAAASSLATFVAGLFAARVLDPASLGVYALFFSGFMLAFAVPDHVVFQPAEVATLRHEPRRRLLALPRVASVGMALSLASATVGVLICVAVAPDVDPDIVVPLAVTSWCAAVVWPLQDHVRQMLHMADRSVVAAAMSMVNAVVVTGALGASLLLPVDVAWVPFSAIALGNVASLAVGLWAWWSVARGDAEPVHLSMRSVLRAGRYYLASGTAPIGATFVVSIIVTRLAGSAALGYAEAARVVAQPVAVIGVGLTATIGPRLLEAGAARDRDRARHLTSVFLLIVTGSGLLAIALVGWAWPLNPMLWLLPQAYVVPWLVTVTIVANVLAKAPNPYRVLLLGANREPAVARVDAVTALAQCVVAATAAVTGAMARPLALAGQSALQSVWLRATAVELFRSGASQPTTSSDAHTDDDGSRASTRTTDDETHASRIIPRTDR